MAIFDAGRALYAARLHCRLGLVAPPISGRTVCLAIISEGINTWPLYVGEGGQLFERGGLNVNASSAGRALDAIAARPQLPITVEGPARGNEVVWDTEGYGRSEGAPGECLDLDYLEPARQAR